MLPYHDPSPASPPLLLQPVSSIYGNNWQNMVGTINDCISNSSENEEISRSRSFILGKRQLLLIEDSVNWLLNSTNRLQTKNKYKLRNYFNLVTEPFDL
jgi:hypothetical protein